MKIENPNTGLGYKNAINKLYGTDIEIWGDSTTYQDWTQYLDLDNRTATAFGFGGMTASYIRDQFIANGDITKTQIFWVGRNGGSVDQIIDDLRMMTNHLDHDRFLVMMYYNGGYYPEFNTGVNYANFIEAETRMQAEYPNNFLNMRKSLINNYDFGDVRLLSSFIQPAIGNNVQVNVSDATFLNTQNASDLEDVVMAAWQSQVRIGGLNLADLYEIVSVDDSTHVTLKLTESNIKSEGETVSNEILYDGGQSYLQIFQELDWQCFNLDTVASTLRKDSIHMTDAIGRKLIAKIVSRFLNARFI